MTSSMWFTGVTRSSWHALGLHQYVEVGGVGSWTSLRFGNVRTLAQLGSAPDLVAVAFMDDGSWWQYNGSWTQGGTASVTPLRVTGPSSQSVGLLARQGFARFDGTSWTLAATSGWLLGPTRSQLDIPGSFEQNGWSDGTTRVVFEGKIGGFDPIGTGQELAVTRCFLR